MQATKGTSVTLKYSISCLFENNYSCKLNLKKYLCAFIKLKFTCHCYKYIFENNSLLLIYVFVNIWKVSNLVYRETKTIVTY